jgi:hypothetical protein
LQESAIVRQTREALGQSFLTALQQLRTKLPGNLEPGPDANPLHGLSVQLVQEMIGQLSQGVNTVLGMTAAAGEQPASGEKPDNRRARRRRKRASRQNQ